MNAPALHQPPAPALVITPGKGVQVAYRNVLGSHALEVFASLGADHVMLTMRGASTSAQTHAPLAAARTFARNILAYADALEAAAVSAEAA